MRTRYPSSAGCTSCEILANTYFCSVKKKSYLNSEVSSEWEADGGSVTVFWSYSIRKFSSLLPVSSFPSNGRTRQHTEKFFVYASTCLCRRRRIFSGFSDSSFECFAFSFNSAFSLACSLTVFCVSKSCAWQEFSSSLNCFHCS